MRFLLLILIVLLVTSLLSGYVEARRQRVSFLRVVRVQWARFKRLIALLVWIVMLVPPVLWAVASSRGEPFDATSVPALYVGCFLMLWLVGAWPFGGRADSD